MSVFVISPSASHIDMTALADGTYELIPDSKGGDLEAQVNTAVLTEAPDQSSEEPRAEIVSDPTVVWKRPDGVPNVCVRSAWPG